MTDNTDIERRTLLHTMVPTSGTALSSARLPRYAAAETAGKPSRLLPTTSRPAEIKTDDNTIFIRRYGKGARCSWCMGFLEPA